ncbi:hypothetical protein [Streptomyces sp. ICBB 8177]|uniref:hypothetical protein n=1 Tax=Streptomyces sp. ICBB 8177 TaxID=563922 RepID=UPI000D677A7C|nr:hypothetical protein [Streptomyces sp. ICBB 8177]PWI44324.1 hypothetical protein CK485_20230 [Streptomyces sp. ICBB 8177]
MLKESRAHAPEAEPEEPGASEPGESGERTGPGTDPATAVPGGLLPSGVALRLALRGGVAGALMRCVLATAAAGVTFLLLASLGQALRHPHHLAAGADRLAWCAPPLVATAWLAVVSARGRAGSPAADALAAIGVGPSRLPRVLAAQVMWSCLLGSVVALGTFLRLRHTLAGAAALPVAGVVTLLLVVPLVAAAACLTVPRPPARTRPLPWGLVPAAAGLACAWWGRHAKASVPLPGGLRDTAPAVLAGWALACAGVVACAPWLVALAGRVLASWRPGPVRLLAGRALRTDARRVAAAVAWPASALALSLAAFRLHAGHRPGAFTLLGAAVVLGSAGCAAVASAAQARTSGSGTRRTLSGLGASRSLLVKVAAVRALVVVGVAALTAAPVGWLLDGLLRLR